MTRILTIFLMLLATSNVTKGYGEKADPNWISIGAPNRPQIRKYWRKILFSGGMYFNGKYDSFSLYENRVRVYPADHYDSRYMTHLVANFKQELRYWRELLAKGSVPRETMPRLVRVLKEASRIHSGAQKAGRMRRGTKVLSSCPGGKTLKQCRVEAIALFKRQMKGSVK